MRADGSGQKRLTNVVGLRRRAVLLSRRHADRLAAVRRSGLIADVWTMKLDGTDQRQITDFGAMSWAPYIHPSGEYIIFASNKLGFENFEVFMVDIDGKKEPVRVTYCGRLRRPARAVARRPAAGVDVEPRRRTRGADLSRGVESRAALAALRAAPDRKSDREERDGVR